MAGNYFLKSDLNQNSCGVLLLLLILGKEKFRISEEIIKTFSDFGFKKLRSGGSSGVKGLVFKFILFLC